MSVKLDVDSSAVAYIKEKNPDGEMYILVETVRAG